MGRWICGATLALCFVLASHAAVPTATAVPCPFSDVAPTPAALLTALQVVRPYNDLLALPTFARCVRDAARVLGLYAAMLALPPRAPGVYSCPKSWDVTYQLTFLAGSAVTQMMMLEADGCRFLHVSDTDVRATYDAFLQVFAATLGMPETQFFYVFRRP